MIWVLVLHGDGYKTPNLKTSIVLEGRGTTIFMDGERRRKKKKTIDAPEARPRLGGGDGSFLEVAASLMQVLMQPVI